MRRFGNNNMDHMSVKEPGNMRHFEPLTQADNSNLVVGFDIVEHIEARLQ